MRIAVAGGTGMVGRLVVREAESRGYDVRVLSRGTGIDLITREGLTRALAGVGAVIDTSNVTTMAKGPSVRFFEQATANLLAAETATHVPHHVALSIVGCDRVDLGYYLGKRRQEQLVEAGPVPWTILRATQFHEFAGQMIDRSPTGLALGLRMRTQPIAAHEVATHLLDAAVAAPAGRLPDLGGPEELRMDVMIRRVLTARGSHRLVVPIPMAGRAGRQVGEGGLLPGPGATLGSQTFDDWLVSAG
ncbi:MAG: NAD-dependent epimerase/dehydratase family protein [Nocardioidaceae bacterium]|nr:NAD-dependent epimerase/dehydratase family protein [Nocardioidaceae bacterium]MCL2612712.1 NAD-dependent epimerase/dehydratase family protein [Nocardioidaceae bacterium]